MQLVDEGSPVLGALAEDPEVEVALRVQSLRELGARGVPGLLEPLLARLLGSSPPELVCAALTIIAARHLDSFSAAVVECAANEHEEVRVASAMALGRLAANEHEEVRVASAMALGRLAANEAERVLIRLLADASSEVQCASAEALGVVGSVAAVEPLLPLAEGLGRAKLRQAARGAIGRIQSRLGSVEAGSLSLADDHELAGAIAIADAAAVARAGEVSLAEAGGEHDPSLPNARERPSR
jgi:HEAT repeat protein